MATYLNFVATANFYKPNQTFFLIFFPFCTEKIATEEHSHSLSPFDSRYTVVMVLFDIKKTIERYDLKH